MGEPCNNELRSSLTHIQLSPSQAKTMSFPTSPPRIRLAFDYETRVKNPLNTRYYTHNYIVLNSIKS